MKTLMQEYLAANATEIEEAVGPGPILQAKELETRIICCRRIYKEHFADTTQGNPGEFQAVMILLTGWNALVKEVTDA